MIGGHLAFIDRHSFLPVHSAYAMRARCRMRDDALV